MASTYLTRTVGTPTNSKKFTFSCWVKLTKLDSSVVFLGNYSDNNNRSELGLSGGNLMQYYARDGGSTYVDMYTTRTLRDINAWYNLIWAVDTTQATASDRVKFYINGVQETVFTGENYPSQNTDLRLNTSGQVINIGRLPNDTKYVDGLMSHINFCDGTQLAPTVFGSTDSTTGEWQINTSPSFTLGNNGFTILKDGNTITDQSSNSNDFTLGGGTLTKSEDCPSNIFCTGNRISNCYGSNLTYSNGNNTISAGSGWSMGSATLGASSGKYYWEYKMTTLGTASGYHKVGFISDQAFSTSAGHNAVSSLDGAYAFYINNGNLQVRTDDNIISGYDNSDLNVSFSNNDIMCVAVDMTNKRAYCRKNDGAWIKSANPVNGTNGLDISSDYPTGSTKAMIPAYSIYENGAGSLNFGNGYFGTSQVASAGTNASGIGIFEYDVPTGYTALSTKGLNE